MLLPFLAALKNDDPNAKGLRLIWITPIRALAKEILISANRAIEAFDLDINVGVRTGDTSTTDRQKQIKKPPQILITTPESLHVMMSSKKSRKVFDHVSTVVVDEWHELMGSKRGVQTELFLSFLIMQNPDIRVWGISATIGNLEEAMDVLLGVDKLPKRVLIKATIKKKIEVRSLLPDKIESYPWAGHLGIKLLEKVIPIIQKSKSTLIFTNTRAQCEIWYQRLLDESPDLAGIMAMHHGSISKEIRSWVEDALYEGKLKAVVCTSSLDLGVDFRPVESIVQIGSPKGVARFVQRAGRSGHQPGATSHIYFVPTHTLELMEASAIRKAIEEGKIEPRMPYIRSWDVLIQYLVTLAVGGGFKEKEVSAALLQTYSYNSMTENEWKDILNHILYGSQSLKAYDEYQKIGISKEGLYLVSNRKIATRHRLSIGTIVSDAMLNVAYVRGKKLGTVEEWFAAHLTQGDAFWFAGRALEFVRIKDMTLQVKPSKKKSGNIPSYMGGRLPLSSQMSKVLRERIYAYGDGHIEDEETGKLIPLFELQSARSILPSANTFLVEYFKTEFGYHIVMFPFEGRNVHEGIAALIAKRISTMLPISFSIAMNDYGFELLSDQQIDIDKIVNPSLFDTDNLALDIQASINAVEMARRKFRDIARISGLIFTGFPGKQKREKHLQSSAQLLFEVFKEYEPDNLLYLQTHEEVMTFQLEEARMREALERIQNQEIVIMKPSKPSPFSFPIIVDRLSREKLSSESLIDRISKMKIELES